MNFGSKLASMAILSALIALGPLCGSVEAQIVVANLSLDRLTGAPVVTHSGKKMCEVTQIRLNRVGQIAEYVALCGENRFPENQFTIEFTPSDVKITLGQGEKISLLFTKKSDEEKIFASFLSANKSPN